MQIVKESDAEGFLFSILLHVAREDIYNLIGVENVNFDDVIVITGHRRQGESRQFEFDSIIAWQEEMVQHRNQCEIKTDTKRKPDWSGGFSKHQMQEAARKIEDDIVSKVRCVKSLYVRFEVDSGGNSWVARLDLYDTNGEFIKQLDIYNVPK